MQTVVIRYHFSDLQADLYKNRIDDRMRSVGAAITGSCKVDVSAFGPYVVKCVFNARG